MQDEDKWIKIQTDIYAKSGFGEADTTVDREYKSWTIVYEYAKPEMTFLDLGCNSGRCCKEMKKVGLSELGIDLPEVVDKIKYDINKKAMNLENDFPEGKWDIIYCRETIEHVKNYKSLAKNIINALNDNGIAIVCCPNNDMDGPKNAPQHVRVFKGNSLKNLMIDSGADIISQFKCKRSTVLVCKRK
jgi:2-polyprenyl-3-methyl-5-hydroxy-6-metoxy-1,4-benzoquinol methylase